MKMHPLLLSLLVVTPLLAFANWKVASSSASFPREPFFIAGNQRIVAIRPSNTPDSGIVAPGGSVIRSNNPTVYAITMSGSLKENLERILERYHWKVMWKANVDYNFDGKITGNSLPNVIEKLLAPFPLQAIMYTANRTVTVIPRTLLGTENDIS